MFTFRQVAYLRGLYLSLLLLLGAQASRAQSAATPPQGYEFMTVTTIESYRKAEAKILLAPPFQGKAEIALSDGDLFRLAANDLEKLTKNTLLVNQQLSALTAAGWELVQIYPVSPTSGTGYNPPITRYLFRKAKN